MRTFRYFFFNDTATTEIYPLSLHDALPISNNIQLPQTPPEPAAILAKMASAGRSEEHTSELQSQSNLVCRLLLEKNKPAAKAAMLAITSLATRTAPSEPFSLITD